MIFFSEKKEIKYIKDYTEKINDTETRKRHFDREQFVKKGSQSSRSVTQRI